MTDTTTTTAARTVLAVMLATVGALVACLLPVITTTPAGAAVGAVPAGELPAVGTVAPASRARGARVVVYVGRITPRRFNVSTADGAAHVLARCRQEDDRRPCVWDARRRGNGVGRSFAVLSWVDHVARIRPRIMRAAYSR